MSSLFFYQKILENQNFDVLLHWDGIGCSEQRAVDARSQFGVTSNQQIKYRITIVYFRIKSYHFKLQDMEHYYISTQEKFSNRDLPYSLKCRTFNIV